MFTQSLVVALLCRPLLISALYLLSPTQISANGSLSSILDGASSSNLSAPPLPAGFTRKLFYRRDEPLPGDEIYENAIAFMGFWAGQPYYEYLSTKSVTTRPGYLSVIVAFPYPDTALYRLQAMHVVLGLQQTSTALVKPENWCTQSIEIWIDNQFKGLVKFEDKTQTTNHNVTEAETTSEPLQSNYSTGTVSARTKTGTIVDPTNRGLTITYELAEARISLDDMFVAYLDALANIAPYDAESAAEEIFGAAGQGMRLTCVVMIEINPAAPLTNAQAIRALLLVWEVLIVRGDHTGPGEATQGIVFTVKLDGRAIGSGVINAPNYAPAPGNMASAEQPQSLE